MRVRLVTKRNVHEKMHIFFSSAFPGWETDPKLFKQLNKEFKFDIDLYASKGNSKCDLYFTENNPAEDNEWADAGLSAFGNPPYGRGLYAKMRHAVKQAKAMDWIVLLLPARVDTRWFKILAKKGIVWFLPGRQSFYVHGEPALVYSKKQGKFIHCKAPFPSVIVILGKNVHEPFMGLYDGKGFRR